jgi:hypothetical protein
MIEKRRRILTHDGFGLSITHHDEGGGPVYRVVESHGNQLAWVGTEENAKARGAEKLKEYGHVCSDSCWLPIDQPEPMSEAEMKTVVGCFKKLAEAVRAGNPHMHELAALQHEYRGHSAALVSGFDATPDHTLALQQLESALRTEIPLFSFYWNDIST